LGHKQSVFPWQKEMIKNFIDLESRFLLVSGATVLPFALLHPMKYRVPCPLLSGLANIKSAGNKNKKESRSRLRKKPI
jgi:hypothetical protein